jgi:hypothetical protein
MGPHAARHESLQTHAQLHGFSVDGADLEFVVDEGMNAAVLELATKHPILRPIFDEHVEDGDPILPYMVMSDWARFIGATYASRGSDQTIDSTIREIVDTLDAQVLTGSDEVQNMVIVGFLEQLPSTGELGTEVRELLTPTLRRWFDEVNW